MSAPSKAEQIAAEMEIQEALAQAKGATPVKGAQVVPLAAIPSDKAAGKAKA